MDSQSEKRKRLAQCEKQASLKTKGFRQNSQNGLNFLPQIAALSVYNVGKLATLATFLDVNDLTGNTTDNKVATRG
jgi:hypothetical protein